MIKRFDIMDAVGPPLPSQPAPTVFPAVLLNEAGEPHNEIKLRVCRKYVIRNRMKYQLEEFSTDGACYRWVAYDPTGIPTPTY